MKLCSAALRRKSETNREKVKPVMTVSVLLTEKQWKLEK